MLWSHRRPSRTRLPYTTLIRSTSCFGIMATMSTSFYLPFLLVRHSASRLHLPGAIRLEHLDLGRGLYGTELRHGETRSEEHTSELQSQSNIVCRLLLEKNKGYQ